MTYIFPFLFSMIVSGVCAWVMSRYGHRWNIVDIANSRSSHIGIIPKGAGIGLPVSFLIIALVIRIPIFIWVPAVAVSLFSFMGDRAELSVRVRLFVQVLCAFSVCIGWVYTSGIHHVYLIFFFVFFITGTTNIYNFMDGINGMAGITAFIGFGFLTWYGISIGSPDMTMIINVAICGASIGFLFFNFPYARVFMGDVGSIFIGFIFAVQVISMAETIKDFLCMVSFILPFYMDEITTMAVRVRDRENLTTGHRKHMYQLLANEGNVSHWKVTLGYAVFQIIIGLLIIFSQTRSLVFIIGLDVFFSILFVLTSIGIRMRIKLT